MNANDDYKISAERIRKLREDRGLSQEQLGKIIGVDRTTIVKYETGASRPTRYLKKMAHYFNVTTDYLIGNEELTPKKGYYFDNETAKIANEMKERPELKTLFDASRKMTPEDIREVNALINAKLQKPEYED